MQRILFLTALIVIAQITPAYAIPLGFLQTVHESIQVGDLQFSNFRADSSINVGTLPSGASSIDVLPIFIAGQPSLRFSGPFLATNGPGFFEVGSYLAGFEVTVLNPNVKLHDARLSYVVTHSGPGFFDSRMDFFSAKIGDTFVAVPPSLESFGGPLQPNPAVISQDLIFPADLTSLGVNLVTFLRSGFPDDNPPNSFVSVFAIEVTFSLEPLPEPTTLLLFGTTMAGLGLARWRRRNLK